MDLLELRDYCLSFPETEETTPFDETTLVYKVAGKMFAVMDMLDDNWVVIKVDPEYGLDLREQHDEITEAYHFNKKHWISAQLDGDLPGKFIKKLVRDSYLLVVEKMPKPKRHQLTKEFIDFEDSQRS